MTGFKCYIPPLPLPTPTHCLKAKHVAALACQAQANAPNATVLQRASRGEVES